MSASDSPGFPFATTVYFLFAYLDYCTESYTARCSRRSRDSTGCWIFFRCTRYRTVYYDCVQNRRVCCKDWTGSGCSSPLCNGTLYCPNGGNCTSPNNCSCALGFSSSDCADIDECLVNNGNCQHICTNGHGNYTCSCYHGFQLRADNHTCSDIDECREGRDECSQICTNIIGSYRCSCHRGYYMRNYRTCSDINECLVNNGNCQHVCTNQQGTYTCSCYHGFQLQTDLHSCADIDECTNGVDGCSHICTNTIGSYECSCPPGHYMRYDHRTCSDINYCAGIDCHSGGTCVDGVLAYKCLCRQGYTGHLCQSDVNECSLLNGGCQDICTNYHGYFQCKCFDNRTLNPDGTSCSGESKLETVFHKHNISGRGLPRGCWVIELVNCSSDNDGKITLSSTSPWYANDDSEDVRFTRGIVHVEVNQTSIPVSLSGVEVHQTADGFKVRFGTHIQVSDRVSSTGRARERTCSSLNISDGDIDELIAANAFLTQVFSSIMYALPNWLQFEKIHSSILNVHNLKTDVLFGKELKSITSCKEAPVFSERLYSVFTFGSDFGLNIYGSSINIQDDVPKQNFCLIIDICQKHGLTVFLMLPKGARGLLSDINTFKTLFEDKGISIDPSGIGLSLSNGIKVQDEKTQTLLWNGDFFNHTVASEANVWIGGDFDYNRTLVEVTGRADVFFQVPSTDRILTSVFMEEWNGLARVTESLAVLTLFGERFQLSLEDIRTSSLDVHMSMGGPYFKPLCGEKDFSGKCFFSAILKTNPLANVPNLKDWSFDITNRAYFYLMSGTRYNITNAPAGDIIDDMIYLNGSLYRLRNFVRNALENIQYYIPKGTQVQIHTIEIAADLVIEVVNNFAKEDSKLSLGQLAHGLNEIWTTIYSLQKNVQHFIESLEVYYLVSDSIAIVLQSEMKTIQETFRRPLVHLNQRIASLFEANDVFGMKHKASVKIFGLEIPNMDVYFVYSSDKSLFCSSSGKHYLKGIQTAIILATTTQELWLGKFLKVDSGVPVEMAYSNEYNDVVIKMPVLTSFLGVNARMDMFITGQNGTINGKLYVWSKFLAQVDIGANHNNDWNDIPFHIIGKFITCQNQTDTPSFHSIYLHALLLFINRIFQNVNKRLTQAQNALSKVQSMLETAHILVLYKEHDVLIANLTLANAINQIVQAERNVENMKESYFKAMIKLNDTYRLCEPKPCEKICISGVRCELCRKTEIIYPCCQIDRCIMHIQSPSCIAANTLCRAVLREIAYPVLATKTASVNVVLNYEFAHIHMFVGHIMGAMFELVVSLAEEVLTLAKAGYEGTKGVLENALVSPEALKNKIDANLKILELSKLGIVVDLDKCTFDILIHTADLPVFDVYCKLNAFKLGWKSFILRINFKHPFQSIWQSAKATIKAILGEIWDSGRSQEHDLTESTQRIANEYIDTLNYTDGFSNDTHSVYDNRVKSFRLKCDTISNVLIFLKTAFYDLFEIANETQAGIDESYLIQSQLQQYRMYNFVNNLTLKEAGIDSQYALHKYNVTISELHIILTDVKLSFSNNYLGSITDTVIDKMSDTIESQIAAAESVQLVYQWLLAMVSINVTYLNGSDCLGFQDCVYHCIDVLNDTLTEEYIPEIETFRSTISKLDYHISNILQFNVPKISHIFKYSEYIMSNISLLSDMNVFCSKPPVFTSSTANQTVTLGSDAFFLCNVSADPSPTIWWYKDGIRIKGKTSATLKIENTTKEDMGVYTCEAGNIVANITSQEMYLFVIHVSTTETNSTTVKEFPLMVIIVLAVILGVLTISIAARIVYRKRHNQAYLNTNPTYGMVSLKQRNFGINH